MAHEHDLHVMPHDTDWRIVRPGSDISVGVFLTQEDAIRAATQMQYDDPDGGEVLIHGEDGQIRERNTINRHDPFPPRG